MLSIEFSYVMLSNTIVMLNVLMLNAIMLNVVMLSVIMLSAFASRLEPAQVENLQCSF